MRSIPLAMTWELLERGRWILPAAALAANALPAILLAALRYDGAVDPGDPSQILMLVLMTQINMFIFGAGVFAAQGNPSRLYAWPAPTVAIVTWHLLPAMALMAIELLVSTAVLNALFDLGWPLWGPAMFLAIALAAVQAVLWQTEKSAWLPVVLTIVAACLGCWYKSRFGGMFSMPTHLWVEVTPGEVMTMLAITGVAHYAAVAGVARNRRGDVLRPLGIVAWIERTFNPAPEARHRFRTPAEAQFWFEWGRKGWAMPAAVVFGMLVGFGLWLIVSRDSKQLLEGLVAGGGLLSVMGLIGGLIMGNSGPNDANFEMGNFLATRPMTSTDMARTILKAAARSVLVAWSIWAAAFLTLYVMLRATHVDLGAVLASEVGWWYFPATLLGAWMVAGLVASVGLTGRSRLFLELFCGGFVLFIALSMFSKYALSRQAQMQFGLGSLAVCGVVLMLATAWAFVAARRGSLVGLPTVYVAFSVWAALDMLVVLERVLHPTVPVAVLVFAVGLLALVVSPLAAAPLAIAWNRNR